MILLSINFINIKTERMSVLAQVGYLNLSSHNPHYTKLQAYQALQPETL